MRKIIIQKILLISFVFFVVFLASGWNKNIYAKDFYVSAGGSINVGKDPTAVKSFDMSSWLQDKLLKAKEFLKTDFYEKIVKEAGSKAFQSAIRTTLQQVAYDTAMFLATGGEGQKPLFFKEGWGEFLSNVGDSAAGNFIEAWGRGANFNLCKPSFDVRMRIGLGLYEYSRPSAPKCTWTEMTKAWDNEYQRLRDLSSDDFLQKFQNMFDPASNDLGIALSLQMGFMENIKLAEDEATKDRDEGDGWLNFRGIEWVRKTFPKHEEIEYKHMFESWDAAYQYTGSALVDAANIFVNTYAIERIKRELRNLASTKPNITSPYGGDYGGVPGYGGLSSYEFGVTGSAQGVADKLRTILEPSFNVRGDYNILAELTSCPNPNKAGPTNCVIEDNFRQAITENLTVGQAMTDGYLNKSGVFGFVNSELEPKYSDGAYPYRSMKILRKYRIIPVGWELAAQYIKDNDVGTCTLEDLVSCYAPDDEFDSFSRGCKISGDQGWCEGLVSPHWVLKAHQNYCAREGYGPELIMTEVAGGQVMIGRNDNYCADEQSCIKESSAGACEKYGYCVEERSKWNFGNAVCDSRYNTCQTFRSTDGRTVSYLENTLDYCDESGVGCSAYCFDYDYGDNKWKCASSDSDDAIFLNRQAETCNQENEGCHEFIRTKTGLGANLVRNSNFSNGLDAWTGDGGATADFSDGASARGALKIEVADDAKSASQIIEGILSGEQISVSYFVKSELGYNSTNKTGPSLRVYAMTSAGTILRDQTGGNLYIENSVPKIDYAGGDYWQQRSFSFVAPNNTAKIKIEPRLDISGTAFFDDIKVEKGTTATQYSDYRQNSLVYLRLMPEYLEDVCTDDDQPAICNNFVRKCSADEAGCELYTSMTDGTQIPGKATAKDVCDSVCVGYDTYVSKATAYDISEPAYFIPRTARTCSAVSVGCEEFTNLDKLGAGAEAREYYSQLKNCIKPSNECAEFYTWEGDNETGFQIRVHQLKTITPSGLPDADVCSVENYNLPITDPARDPDCREFVNRAGTKLYYLYSSIIECTENCHPYRLSDPYGQMNSAKCLNLKGDWLNNACVFMAIPDKGVKCSAQQVGCREYNGNQGNDMRILFTEGFEGDHSWIGGEISQESVVSGEKSLRTASSSLELGYALRQNSAYVLSFIAKGADNTVISAMFDNGGEFTGTVLSGTDWGFYKINLDRFTGSVDENEKLTIRGGGGSAEFYIDNIRLTEIRNRYYLVKNSWNTPNVCDEDIYGNFSLYYDLGCDHYQDRDRVDHYFHNFSELCSESSAGCELMIDTHNYSDYNGKAWNDYNVSVPADSLEYVVYDPKKSCSYADKGCQFLGKIYEYENNLHFTDTYLKNDPDKYNQILCGADDVGCEAWQHEGGPSYFKDPQLRVCEWRQVGGSFDWYKQNVKRCGGVNAGNLCFRDGDCAGEKCQEITSNEPCSTNDYKTIGLGGYGNNISQPTQTSNGLQWAGACPAVESGCSEYIDPLSNFSPNVIFNPNFSDIDGDDTSGDGWSGNSQEVRAEPYTLYILSASGGNNSASISGCDLRIFDFNVSKLSDTLDSTATTNSTNNAVMFFTQDVSTCTVSGGAVGKTINLRKAFVDYQNKTKIDRTGCNGIVNNNSGCVLFNERTITSSGYANLTSNAYKTNTNQAPQPIAPNNANALLKVKPDRVCNKWLSCLSYVKDDNGNNHCFNIGLCDSFDENNNCASPIVTASDPINYTYGANVGIGEVANLSGYSKVGYAGSTFSTAVDRLPNDLYSLGEMSEVGENVYVPNGSFEFAGENGYPVGWNYEKEKGHITQESTEWGVDGSGSWSQMPVSTLVWDSNIFKVVNSVVEANSLGVCYRKTDTGCYLFAPDGSGFLQVGATYSATSEPISVIPGDYTLTGYINTMNLLEGNGRISVLVGNEDREMGIVSNRKGWTYVVGNLNITSSQQIKIKLSASGDAKGSVYFDHIQIKPALEVKTLNNDKIWRVPQTCRLYPGDSSLSCDYYGDSGVRKKGWEGYCLDYDRYPGSSDACLLWYPIDKVKGAGIEEGAGYRGKFPVYYSFEVKAEKFLEYRHAYVPFPCGEYNVCPNSGCQSGYEMKMTSCYELSGNDLVCCACIPAGAPVKLDGSSDFVTFHAPLSCNTFSSRFVGPNITSSRDGWYPYDGSLASIPQSNNEEGAYITGPNAPYLCDGANSCRFTQEVFRTRAYATKIVQTVNSVGQSKHWASRVFEGSDYELLPYGYKYEDVSSPFGSILSPVPTNNPYEWDGNPISDVIEPLYYGGTKDPRQIKTYISSGNPFSCVPTASGDCNNLANVNDPNYPYAKIDLSYMNTETAKEALGKLFAQSYGAWEWNGSNYALSDDSGLYWGPPTDPCPNQNNRGEAYCAILPTVSNINITGYSGSAIINGSGFVNLRFNSNADDDQLPLVMYSVNWGDNEQTTVSGVEMRDRPGTESPHSLYHLYSYWDMKSKDNRGSDTIYCGGAGQVVVGGPATPPNKPYCAVKPGAVVKDNWGWCSNGRYIEDCEIFEYFPNWIIVTEN